jgi:prepilin-type N-terminal cleavage/methylation domain-containing protein
MMNFRERLRKQDNGFTLLEVMIALTVLSFALLSLVSMAATVIRGNVFSNKVATATTLAQDEMERIKGLSYNLIPAQAGTEDYGTITGYPSFRRVVAVTPDSPLPNTKTVTVTVSWIDNQMGSSQTRTVAINTIIHDPNP